MQLKVLVRDEKLIAPIHKHWTDVKVEESIGFIEEMHASKQPFFLNLWFDAPHAPYEATPEVSMSPYNQKSQRERTVLPSNGVSFRPWCWSHFW